MLKIFGNVKASEADIDDDNDIDMDGPDDAFMGLFQPPAADSDDDDDEYEVPDPAALLGMFIRPHTPTGTTTTTVVMPTHADSPHAGNRYLVNRSADPYDDIDFTNLHLSDELFDVSEDSGDISDNDNGDDLA